MDIFEIQIQVYGTHVYLELYVQKYNKNSTYHIYVDVCLFISKAYMNSYTLDIYFPYIHMYIWNNICNLLYIKVAIFAIFWNVFGIYCMCEAYMSICIIYVVYMI